MLQLLSLLQTHRYWPGGELAGRLEVSPRTLRRDVERLRDLGYPVDADRGVGGGYQLRAGAALPPMLLDADEAVAIAVALRTAAGASVAGIEDAAIGALAKIVQVMPPALRRRVDALHEYTVPSPTSGPVVDAGDLTVLAQACRDGERVRMTYRARERDPGERVVEPHRLVALGRRWYLVAWDTERADWRTFRLDRLADARPTGARFRPREVPGGDAGEFVRTSIGSRPRHEVRLRVQAPAEAVQAAVRGWGRAEPLDDATSHLHVDADSFDWVVLLVSLVGADVEVEHPPELRAVLRATGERLVRAAAAGTAVDDGRRGDGAVG
ncbi:YafY family protein [Angustibacter peucedani]